MTSKRPFSAFSILLLCLTAAAQQAAPAQQPAGPENEKFVPGDDVKLLEGTRVPLAFAQPLSAKSAVVGQPVELIVTADVKADDEVVLTKGTRVLGTVAQGKENEKRGISRDVGVKVEKLMARGKNVPLRGSMESKSKINKGKAIAATAAFGLSGLLLATAPHNFVIPEGTPLDAYVDSEVILPSAAKLSPSPTPPAPNPQSARVWRE